MREWKRVSRRCCALRQMPSRWRRFGDYGTLVAMRTITDIEQAVQELAPQELAKFREWFAEFDAAQWDLQIERDAAAGRLDALAGEASDELREGR